MKIEAVIFDFNWTLVKGEGNTPSFYPGTVDVLNTLYLRGIRMGLVSAGGDDPALRYQQFKDLKLRKLGISVFKVVGPGQPKDLQPILDELGVEAQHCLIVGDRIKREIKEGKKIKARTVWIEQGPWAEKEKPETPEEQPDYIIKSLPQILPVIDSLNS